MTRGGRRRALRSPRFPPVRVQRTPNPTQEEFMKKRKLDGYTIVETVRQPAGALFTSPTGYIIVPRRIEFTNVR